MEAGNCSHCGKSREGKHKRFCQSCKERIAARSKERYRENRAAVLAHVAAARRAFIAAGLCSTCGGERDDVKKKICRVCLHKSAAYSAKYKARKRQKEKETLG